MVSLQELEYVLQQEVDYFHEGATAYRRRTAELAFQALQSADSTSYFSNRPHARQYVSAIFATEDDERIDDVAKALTVAYAMCRREKLMTPEFQEQLAVRRANRRKISLVKAE
ncbi:hypothetical protein NCCP2716_22670 [Sporosarcina sp. NCCP-2716]|nr:hypothetical protein NCCP2716_22670 [Sporosarcina sp. NCCP-2716]